MAETKPGLKTSDFEYPLPSDLIAQLPSAVRGESRLLVVRRKGATAQRRNDGPLIIPPSGIVPRIELGHCEDRRFSDLLELIPPGDLLVLNSTKVRHARLLGLRPSGAPTEVLLLHPSADETWLAMGRPGSALRVGKRVVLAPDISLETVEELPDGYRRVRFHGATAVEAMDRIGRLPLPPYIDREPTPEDDLRYQTVFAEREGSVAAPTAGLHFTPELLGALESKGVLIARLDLEVGPGTFKPVESEDFSTHPMHPEQYEISPLTAERVNATRTRGGAVWAVGTTVVRALESAAREDGTVVPGPGETRLMITPGYGFRVVDRLITNFHLPRSTLLMLVAGFAGYEETMAAYRIAVEQGYRFYSYGDAMLAERQR